MILPSVSETLASVGRQSALESAISALRQGTARERIAGLTNTGKALLAAIVATELRRPMVVLVETGARAEEFAASMQFFYRALAGQEATEVTVLPAMDVLPWQEAAAHAEILETRAVTLWRYATGQARIVVAPIAAARMRLSDAAHYAEQARTLAREDPLSLDDLVTHLRRVGYESHDMVEMPGQFTVRGGIVDIFPAEAERPVRLELFGDTVESLREFDPNTQRSVRPIDRITLPPLVEQSAIGFVATSENPQAVEKISRAHSIVDLHEDTVILLDEPGAIKEASHAFLQGAAEDLESKKGESLDAISSYYFTDEWDCCSRDTRAWNLNTLASRAKIPRPAPFKRNPHPAFTAASPHSWRKPASALRRVNVCCSQRKVSANWNVMSTCVTSTKFRSVSAISKKTLPARGSPRILQPAVFPPLFCAALRSRKASCF